MRNTIYASIIVFVAWLILFATSIANASTYRYEIEGTFQDSGVFAGYVDYDTGAGTFTDGVVDVSGGTFTPFTYDAETMGLASQGLLLTDTGWTPIYGIGNVYGPFERAFSFVIQSPDDLLAATFFISPGTTTEMSMVGGLGWRNIVAGSITSATNLAQTPLPAAWMLMVPGLLFLRRASRGKA